jgi:hypothetical protein
MDNNEQHKSRLAYGHILITPGITGEDIPDGTWFAHGYKFTCKDGQLTGTGKFKQQLCTTHDCLIILYWLRRASTEYEYLTPMSKEKVWEDDNFPKSTKDYPIEYRERFESGMV